MELFSISCTTCKSRLKVREAGAIGQILACPKCGGMVMVKAPPGWEPGKPVPVPKPEPPPGITAVVEMRRPNETLGDSQFDAVDDLLSDAPPKVKPSTVSIAADAPGLARPRFVGGPPAHAPAHPASGKPANGHAASPPVAEAAPEPAKANGQPVATAEPPPPEWSSPKPWRYWALAASVVAGIGMVIAVVVASRSLFRGSDLATTNNVNPPAVSPQPSEPPTVTEPPATNPPPAVNPAVPLPVEPMPVVPVEPMPPVQPAVENPMPPDSDPLGLTKPPMPMPVEPTKPKPPDQLAAFNNILAPETDPIVQPEAAPTTAATPPAATDPAATPEKPVLPRPAPRAVNVTARLTDALPGIKTEGTPLVDFLQVMSDLSTIPMTLEPDALPFAKGTSVTSPVTLDLTNASVGSALTTALKSLGLEHVVEGDQVTVRLTEPATPLALNYPVKDLTGSDLTRANDLAAMLQAIAQPASWGPEGGTIEVAKDSLKITQRRAVHAQVFFLCEKLRTARKLPYASTFSPSLFSLSTRSNQATAKLQTPITLNFSQPTRFTRILQRLEQTAGVRILVDWRDIASAGWNPDGEATLVADKTPLSESLDKLLTPMDLTWRVVDAVTLQVSTPAAQDERIEIELYPAGSLVTGDPTGQTLMAEICQALGNNLFRDGGGPGELQFDETSLCLIAALPQPKQQELESLLAKLAAAIPSAPAKPAAVLAPPVGK